MLSEAQRGCLSSKFTQLVHNGMGPRRSGSWSVSRAGMVEGLLPGHPEAKQAFLAWGALPYSTVVIGGVWLGSAVAKSWNSEFKFWLDQWFAAHWDEELTLGGNTFLHFCGGQLQWEEVGLVCVRELRVALRKCFLIKGDTTPTAPFPPTLNPVI